ncbi:cation/H(+) antiporter 3-like [Abrus precatorius]|uniref:Cation/H(+) antiporter 3-like n=1 Tax=Abrus precatorius TaxID=3816 RepID=A0A8B8MMF6_ABRPR|nr:cation/H(+) antiporter 3-like [Abrus precatorius]
MDFNMIRKSGKMGWIIALLGLAIPLVICDTSRHYFVASYLQASYNDGGQETLVILITQNITSFAVIASILNDLQILNSELGRLTMSCALVSDMLGYTLVLISSILDKHSDIGTRGIRMGFLFALVIIIFFVYRPAMFWVIDQTSEKQEVKDIYLNMIIGALFTLGWFSVILKQEIILLPFIFGLATPEGPPLGSSLVKRIHVFGTEFLLPIFLTTCAMKANLYSLDFSSAAVRVAIFIALLGYLAKMLTCFASSLYFKLPVRDALALALLLNSKGVVEDIHPETFTVIIIIIMITSCIVHLLVKRLYDPSRKYAGYQKRNIFDLKPNSDLRILVCIHKQHHTIPIIRALDLCYPTTEALVIVDTLHLIELVGRSTPIFISHRKKKVDNSCIQNSYSENVILSFKLYEDEKEGAITINPYTAISPPRMMHGDVCNLALDKVASIIILPFHRIWSIDGKIEHEDKNIRSLNCKVMERAPCSVGILVSRSVHQSDSPLRLAMIFLGGNDDREALCIANRAAKDPSINLVIYHITPKNTNEHEELEDSALDMAMLNDTKNKHSHLENVSHKEIEVEGGPQIASILRQMVEDHDFFIVGRRHGIDGPQTKGLQEWSEFSELGLIGDYLASADLDCNSSILVVQQQEQFS